MSGLVLADALAENRCVDITRVGKQRLQKTGSNSGSGCLLSCDSVRGRQLPLPLACTGPLRLRHTSFHPKKGPGNRMQPASRENDKTWKLAKLLAALTFSSRKTGIPRTLPAGPRDSINKTNSNSQNPSPVISIPPRLCNNKKTIQSTGNAYQGKLNRVRSKNPDLVLVIRNP